MNRAAPLVNPVVCPPSKTGTAPRMDNEIWLHSTQKSTLIFAFRHILS